MTALLSVAQMRAADAAAMSSGTPGALLMENAGRAVAMTAIARFPSARRVLVLCGPGANGGDGFVAARRLAEAGMAVRVALLGDRTAMTGDAATAAARWAGPVEAIEGVELNGARLVIDAVFGTGLSRELPSDVARPLAAARARDIPILAVDVPSGLDGDTGSSRGDVTPASVTVTFARAKTGHVLLPGRALCGEVIVMDIGIASDVIDALGVSTWRNTPRLWGHERPRPRPDGHKYQRGHALVVSGPALASGAARLAALSAHRVGAGLVTIAGPREALTVHAGHLSAQMLVETVTPADLARRLEDKRFTSVVIGPALGLTTATRAWVEAVVQAARPAVLDADALSTFAGDPHALARAIRAPGSDVVITPHAGEFTRLFKDLPDISQAPSKLVAGRRAAALLGAVVIMKGADSVVAAPDGRASIASNAPPTLATAGSGDVLAGLVGGLLAQGMDSFHAACAAVWLHGASASGLGPGLTADDLPHRIPSVLASLR